MTYSGRLLSFDIDGVVADSDSAMLGLLHRAHDQELLGAREHLLSYYARRPVMLDPRSFTLPGDVFILVSGRIPIAHELTRRWVAHHFPECAGLFLVSDDSVEEVFRSGRYDEAFTMLAERKHKVLQEHLVDLHFDNSPRIVRYVREHGILAVLVGGAIV